jgi:hypothetical protein
VLSDIVIFLQFCTPVHGATLCTQVSFYYWTNWTRGFSRLRRERNWSPNRKSRERGAMRPRLISSRSHAPAWKGRRDAPPSLPATRARYPRHSHAGAWERGKINMLPTCVPRVALGGRKTKKLEHRVQVA